MSYKVQMQSFPTEVTEPIQLPSIEELLLMPMVINCDIEELYKHGTDFHRMIIDKTPLKNKNKYIAIKSYVNFLYPGVSSHQVKTKTGILHEWHTDSFDGSRSYWHIMSSKVDALTEFNVNPFEYDFGHIENIRMILSLKHKYFGIVGKKIEPCRIYTFSDFNIHRCSEILKPEFRYFYRVMETDHIIGSKFEDALVGGPKIKSNTVSITNGHQIPNIEVKENGIFIHYNFKGEK